MAGYAAKVRFVRCPKCSNLLMELADVPVYQCGGCGIVLRAKNQSANGGDASILSPEAKQSPKVSGHDPSNNEPTSVEEEIAPCSSDGQPSTLHTKEEQTVISEVNPSSLTEEDNHHEKEESLVGEEGMMNSIGENQLEESIANEKDEAAKEPGSTSMRDGMEEPANSISQNVALEEDITGESLCDVSRDTFQSPPATSSQAHGGSASSSEDGYNDHLRLSDRAFESIETGADYPVNEDGKKPLNMTMSNKMEEAADTISKGVALEEDIIDERLLEKFLDTCRTAAAGSSRAHGGSVSFSDDGYNDHLRSSNRACRQHQRVMDSSLSLGQERHEAILGNKGLHIHAERQPEDRNILMKSLNQRYGSATMGSFSANGSRFSSGYGSSPNSEEFYSVQNWKEAEKERYLRSLSRGSAFPGNSLHYRNGSSSTKFRTSRIDSQELLRKVDELREEVGGFYGQRVEEKGRNRSIVARQIQSILESIDPELLRHPKEAHYSPRNPVPHHYRYSQMPFMEHPQCSCLHCLPAYVCSRSEASSHPPTPLYHPHEFEKKSVKEKRPQRAKHHCRPISGGAPFVICNKCLQLLQLPVDSLISRRRLYKLKCGACSEVLVFSSEGKDLMNPRTPTDAVDQLRELDNYANRRYPSPDYSQGDPVSYAEDFDLPYSRSYSTDTAEQFLNCSRNSPGDRNSKLVAGQRLHWLMGYDSARELMYQPDYSDEEHSSREISVRRSRQPSEESNASLGSRGRRKGTPLHESSAGGTSAVRMMKQEDETARRLGTQSGGGVSPVRGMGKKGVRKLNQALVSLRLKAYES